MKRLLLIAASALTLFGLTMASAAYLVVDGGVLQAISEHVTLPMPPSPTPESCTHTPDYWKNQTESWPVAQLTLGDTAYPQPFLLAILNLPAAADISIAVAQPLIAAKLNVAQGVEAAAIGETIAQAEAWLAAHPFASQSVQQDWQPGIALLRQLEQYNNGEAGPRLCSGEQPQQITMRPTPTLTPSPTLTPTLTATIEPTATWTPTATAAPTAELVVLNVAVVWQDATGAPNPTRPPHTEAFSIEVTGPGRAAHCRYIAEETRLSCSFVYYDAEGRADGLWLQGGAPYTVVANGVPQPFAVVSGVGDFVAGAGQCSGALCMHTVTFRENGPLATPTSEQTATPIPTATPPATATVPATATALPTATATQPAAVAPRLQCVAPLGVAPLGDAPLGDAPLGDDRYVAYFDYAYDGDAPRTIAAGPDNFLAPDTAEGTVPTRFVRHSRDQWPEHRFAVLFEGEQVTWTVDGRRARAATGSPICAQMVEVTVVWMQEVRADAPVNATDAVTVTAHSNLGTAVCPGGAASNQNIHCRYENDVPQPLPLAAGLWVGRDTRYQVAIEGLSPEYRAVGVGAFYAADLDCNDGALTCEHRVLIVPSGAGRATPTPQPAPSVTPAATATVTTPHPSPPPSSTPAPTPTAGATPLPTSTAAPAPSATPEPTAPATGTPALTATPSPTASATIPAATPAATAPPMPTATPTPTATWTPTPTPAPTLPPTSEPAATPPPTSGAP